jgi:AraC-like DNA-binding protein
VTLIPPNTPHECDAGDATVALLLIEPHGARGAALARRAYEVAGTDLQDVLGDLPFPPASITAAAAARWCEAVCDALGARSRNEPLSVISRRAISHVERNTARSPKLADAAATAGVSPTRLTHVFTREVGIPFRRFVLWTKLKRAVAASVDGDLTTAAQRAGFADSAHLSRTFHATFGLSPSRLLPHVELFGP